MIVVAVLLLFMGVRSGLLIGFVLVITISGTFCLHGAMEHRTGADLPGCPDHRAGDAGGQRYRGGGTGTLVRIQKGMKPEQGCERGSAADDAAPARGYGGWPSWRSGRSACPDDSTGEFCRSLFQVVLIALGLSWITAVSVTPVLCVHVSQTKPDTGMAWIMKISVTPYGGRAVHRPTGGTAGVLYP